MGNYLKSESQKNSLSKVADSTMGFRFSTRSGIFRSPPRPDRFWGHPASLSVGTGVGAFPWR